MTAGQLAEGSEKVQPVPDPKTCPLGQGRVELIYPARHEIRTARLRDASSGRMRLRVRAAGRVLRHALALENAGRPAVGRVALRASRGARNRTGLPENVRRRVERPKGVLS